jgi:hypothetical protein
MKPMLILPAMILSSIPQSSDQPYELKGESPGMTLKQFRGGFADCFLRFEICSDVTPITCRIEVLLCNEIV